MIREGQINRMVASRVAPNPAEVPYWIDLTMDPYGKVIRVYQEGNWELVTAPMENIIEMIMQVQQDLQQAIDKKADKATTLAGYNITDAYTKTNVYTKTEADNKFAPKAA